MKHKKFIYLIGVFFVIVLGNFLYLYYFFDNSSSVKYIVPDRPSIGVNEESGNEKYLVKQKTNFQDHNIVSFDSVSIDTLIYSSNVPNLIHIKGLKPGVLNSIRIGDQNFQVINFDGNVYIQIEQGTFGDGIYDMIFYLNTGESFNYKDKITFWKSKQNNIFISAIHPNIVDNRQAQYVVLQGIGFEKILSIQLSNNIVFKKTDFQVINDSVIALSIPSGLKPGLYSLNLMSLKGIYNSELYIRIR